MADARAVVKTGDIVKVRVVEVDVARKRIALSMKLGQSPDAAPAARGAARDNRFEPARSGQRAPGRGPAAPAATAMASAFAKLQTRR